MPSDIPEESRRAAALAVRQLSAVAALSSDGVELFIAGSDVPVRVPAGALFALIEVLSHMSRGHGVRVIPVAAELSTRQAPAITPEP